MQKNNIPVDVESYKTLGVMFAVPKYVPTGNWCRGDCGQAVKG